MLQTLDGHGSLQAPLHALWFFLRRSRLFAMDNASNLILSKGAILTRSQFLKEGATGFLSTGHTLLHQLAVSVCSPPGGPELSSADERALQVIDIVLAVAILVDVYGADPAQQSRASSTIG